MARDTLAEGLASSDAITTEELQLAARNHGMPLEGLRYDVTPIGMHYLLTHFDVPAADEAGRTVEVGGLVKTPLRLNMDHLRSRPAVTKVVTMECAGNGRARLHPRPISQPWIHEAVGTAEWTGTPLGPILREAGLEPEAVEVVFSGADRGIQGGVEHDYERSLSVADATVDDVLLVYEMNGRDLPPQHGYPVRVLVPGWYGMTNVKWLRRIWAVAEPFEGFQMKAYRLRRDADDPGTPVTRMQPRALMMPPGIPEFLGRHRVVDAGPCALEGRAWSGWAPIERVEVSTDGGRSWQPARVAAGSAPFAWSAWRFDWQAAPGEHELVVRAIDAKGNAQPIDEPWNHGGFENNTPQRVTVTVR